jgi:hypothetical protein
VAAAGGQVNGLVTITEAARALAVSRESLAHHVKHGHLATVREKGPGPGGPHFVRLEEVRAFYAARPPRRAAAGHHGVPDVQGQRRHEHGHQQVHDDLAGAGDALVACLVGRVLDRGRVEIGARAKALDREVERQAEAAAQLEAELARTTSARQAAEQEAARLRLSRQALEGRRAEMSALMAGTAR